MVFEEDADGTKVCPMCAEHIQQDARVCKHCGYNYTSQSIDGAPTKTNGLAIASLVLGIIWIYWVGSILAIIFGHVALSQIKATNGTQQGRGMAIAGLVLGYLGIVVFVAAIAYAVFISSVTEIVGIDL